MNKNIIGAIAFVLFFLAGQSVFAHDLSPMCGDRIQHMVDTLKLDGAQQTKIKAIKEQLKNDQMPNWKKMGDLRDQMNQLIQSDSMDQSKLDGLVTEQAQLIGATIKAKAIAENQIFGVLNAQQKIQYPQMIKQKEEKIKEMFEKCGE